jgi:DNA-binding transcriptional regulator YdaS (Cro superfamily)
MTTDEALTFFGTGAALARALKIKPPSVSEWVTEGVIPIGRQCQIEIITDGALRADRSELTPSDDAHPAVDA